MERDASDLPVLPARPADGHKGTFGTVSVIGGCDGPDAVMLGAPVLAARAALRSGCGLVRLVMARPLLYHALAIEPQATGVALRADVLGHVEASHMSERIDEVSRASRCLVVGPGLGLGEVASSAVLRAIRQEDAACVLDADALTLMSRTEDLTREIRARAILTPHPGEYLRLARSLRLPLKIDGEDDRLEACAALAQRLGCVCVLKGHGTVVSDGLRVWVCAHGGVELAVAGTGDVLGGIIAGIVSQHAMDSPLPGLTPEQQMALAGDAMRTLSLYDAARVGVEIHARAGEAWRARHAGARGGLLARELCDEIPAIVQGMRSAPDR